MKLALHWQILIGLIAGIIVGLIVNVTWSSQTWWSLGVGDPSGYLTKPGAPPADAPRMTDPAGVVRFSETEGVLLTFEPDQPAEPRHVDAVRTSARWAAGALSQPASDGQRDAASQVDVARTVAWLLKDLPTVEPKAPEPTADARRAAGAWLVDSLRAIDTGAVAPAPLDASALDPQTAMAASYITLDMSQLNRNAGLPARLAWFVSNLNNFFGDLFIRCLRFIAVPIVLFSLIVGASSLNDLKKLSRIGGKTIGIYLCTTAVAISTGLLLANIVKPGRFVPPEMRDRLAADTSAAEAKLQIAADTPTVWDTLLNIVPTNPFNALAEGAMLQVVFFALIIGVGLTLIPKDKAGPIVHFCDGLTHVIIKFVHMIMVLAPYAVFALLVKVVANLGLDILQALIAYSVVVIAGLAIMIFGIYPLGLKIFTPVAFGRFYKAIAPAQLLAFSSSSSSATLPVTMDCAEKRLGASEDVSSFVLPLGATINMDGTALYQGVATVFIAQMFSIDLSLSQQLMIVLTATLASIGTAGVPGVGIIMLIIVLQAVNMPATVMTTGIAIILGVDRLLDMCRTTCNVTGDCMVTAVVASSENELASADEMARRAAASQTTGLDEHPHEDREEQY